MDSLSFAISLQVDSDQLSCWGWQGHTPGGWHDSVHGLEPLRVFQNPGATTQQLFVQQDTH